MEQPIEIEEHGSVEERKDSRSRSRPKLKDSEKRGHGYSSSRGGRKYFKFDQE